MKYETRTTQPQTWYFVCNPYRQELPTVRHEDIADAILEAERICKIEGNKIHVLQCVGTVYPATYIPRK